MFTTPEFLSQKMMEFFGALFNAERLPRLNVGFKNLGVVGHLSVILSLPDVSINSSY